MSQTAGFASYKDAVSQLTSEEHQRFDAWLNVVLPPPNSSPRPDDTPALARELICRRIPGVTILRALLEKYANFQKMEQAHTLQQETQFVATVAGYLSKSTLLQKYYALTQHDLATCVHFLDHAAFYRKRCEVQILLNPSVSLWTMCVMTAPVELMIEGFESEGVFFLRKGNMDIHDAIHEVLHKMAPKAHGILGHVLNEGLIEEITLQVCTELSVEVKGTAYLAERSLLKGFCGRYKISEQEKVPLLFENPQRLIDCIAHEIGDARCQEVVETKDPLAASNLFAEYVRQGPATPAKTTTPAPSQNEEGCILL